MTVKWLMHWQPNPGAPLNSQILTEPCQFVEGLNGVKDGRWKSSLTFYRPMIRDTASSLGGVEHPRDFMGLALQEQPSKYYFILRAHRIVLEADTSIQSVMEKLQSYKARIVLNFEGFQYKLGDFQLRVGKCVPSMSESFEGNDDGVAQKKCEICRGSGLVLRDDYYIRCPNCGGFLPWQSWKRFFTG